MSATRIRALGLEIMIRPNLTSVGKKIVEDVSDQPISDVDPGPLTSPLVIKNGDVVTIVWETGEVESSTSKSYSEVVSWLKTKGFAVSEFPRPESKDGKSPIPELSKSLESSNAARASQPAKKKQAMYGEALLFKEQ